MTGKYKVLLPKHLWQQHRYSLDEFRAAVYQYMERYPHYEVLGVAYGFAVCERKERLV